MWFTSHFQLQVWKQNYTFGTLFSGNVSVIWLNWTQIVEENFCGQLYGMLMVMFKRFVIHMQVWTMRNKNII